MEKTKVKHLKKYRDHRRHFLINDLLNYTSEDFCKFHKCQLNISDPELLETIILKDALAIKAETQNYNQILHDITETNVLNNIIKKEKENSLAYFRGLLLLAYNDYKIIEYLESLRDIFNYHTIEMTAIKFNESQEYIKNLHTQFYSYYYFFKEYFNDISFINIISTI